MAAEPERPRELAREAVDLFLDGRGAPRVVKGGQLRELAVELAEARLVCGSSARVGEASGFVTRPDVQARLPLAAARPRARAAVGVPAIDDGHQLRRMELAPPITHPLGHIGASPGATQPPDR